MSKMSNAVAEMRQHNSLRRDEVVTNFMGGDSYVVNPLDTLKMITASSIFGEPSYYRDGKRSGKYMEDKLISGFTVLPDRYKGMNTEQIMEDAIDKALDYNFGATLEWAMELRKNFNMRLNPQVIMVRAAMHPKRKEYTEKHPAAFGGINQFVMSRADEPMSQMAYFLYKHGGKKNDMPSILKRSWAKKISGVKRYQMAKYKNHEIGMINAVRLCHANSEVIDELMRTGTVAVDDNQKTWENLRSQGKSWKEIFNTVDMGHMALLRNLRGVFTEVNNLPFCKRYLEKLKSGVIDGKQFPFRYYSALKAVESEHRCNHRSVIIDALEECMDIALANFPKLSGKTMCLSDNSGSAWGTIPSEYGSVKVAEIDNLSSVITAACSDEGYVGKFGDRLKVTPISKRRGVLSQAKEISRHGDNDVGGATEGGIWEFFNNAIKNKEHWDNIFIYSDQQAGHGGLYGTSYHASEYGSKYGCGSSGFWGNRYINVFKLIQEYRRLVNPKVNVFSIQTAGYDNVLIPEMAERCAILYGWTGNEATFAKAYTDIWDNIQNSNKK